MALFFYEWVRYRFLPYLSSAYPKRTWLVEVSPRKEYGRCYKRLELGRCVEGAPSTRPGSFAFYRDGITSNRYPLIGRNNSATSKGKWVQLLCLYTTLVPTLMLPPVFLLAPFPSTEVERREAVEEARKRTQNRGLQQAASTDYLYEKYILGIYSLLELRYAIEGVYHRRHTPACWRLWVLDLAV